MSNLIQKVLSIDSDNVSIQSQAFFLLQLVKNIIAIKEKLTLKVRFPDFIGA